MFISVSKRTQFERDAWSFAFKQLETPFAQHFFMLLGHLLFTVKTTMTKTLLVGKNFPFSVGYHKGLSWDLGTLNIYYYEVKRQHIPQGVSMVGYADDLAIVATANNERMLQIVVKHTIDTIRE